MLRRARFLITLGFFLSTSVLHAAPADRAAAEAVKARAKELYGVLLNKNARHYRLREDLAPFFANEEEMNAFLVRLAKDLDDKGIVTNKLESVDVEVLEAESHGFAETLSEVEGEWILCFSRTLERRDQWKLVDDRWLVNPPPLKDLEIDE